MYNPTPQQAEIDRKKAYDSGIPHGAASTAECHITTHEGRRCSMFEGCICAGAGYVAPGNKYKDLPTISMLVVSELVGCLCTLYMIGDVSGTTACRSSAPCVSRLEISWPLCSMTMMSMESALTKTESIAAARLGLMSAHKCEWRTCASSSGYACTA